MFVEPTKKINDERDLPTFKKTQAFQNLHNSIQMILQIVKSQELPKNVADMSLVNTTATSSSLPPVIKPELVMQSHNGKLLISTLKYLMELIEQTPPIEGPRRFGNYAYKDWYQKMVANVGGKLEQLNIQPQKPDFMIELTYYLKASFGSNIRLDYGTGHELSFVAFIGSLLRFNLLDTSGQELLVIFCKYYDLVRKLILTYSLEPAGSHGVWGLDDHFHFIYIIGAAQFNDPISKYSPSVSHCLNDTIISEFLSSNLYINALAFIKKIKTGPFANHSPMLNDIHKSVSLWKKVLSGLLKMYDVEVLGKFPVVQHFWFGSGLYPWRDSNNNELPVHSPDNDSNDQTHSIQMTAAPWKTLAPTSRIPHSR